MTSSPTHTHSVDGSAQLSANALAVCPLPDVHLDPSAAMEASYPCASKAEMDEFVQSLDEEVEATPSNLLLVAADMSRWSILHSLIKNEATMVYPNEYVSIKLDMDRRPKSYCWNAQGCHYDSQFIVLCVENGDFTVIRYVLNHIKQFQIAKKIIPLAFEYLYLNMKLGESLWLLQNMQYSNDVINLTYLALINVVLYADNQKMKDYLMLAMRTRGAKGMSILGMYASLPNLLSMEFVSELMIEPNSNFNLYPLVNMEIICSFASSNHVGRNDSARILLTAASQRQWDIVFTLLKKGISPLDTDAMEYFSTNGDLYNMTYCKSLPTCNADYLLISAAAANNLIMLQFLLTLQSQIGYSRCAIESLPYVACRNDFVNVAVWLLDTLDMNDLEYNEAFLRCISWIANTSDFHSLAIFLEIAATACRSLDLVAIVKTCFCSSMDSYTKVQKFVFNSSILPSIIAAAAKLALPCFLNNLQFKKESKLQGYKHLYAFLQRFESSQLSAIELGIQDAVKNNHIELLDQSLESCKQEPLLAKLVYQALLTAIKIQNFNLFRHICATNTASELVIYEYLTGLLIAASIQDDCQFMSFIFKAATTKFDSNILSKVKAFVHHVIVESRVRDLLPLLKASILGSFADTVCQMVGLVMLIYREIFLLDEYLDILVKLMSPNAIQSFVLSAMDQIYHYGISPTYYKMLLNVARLHEDVFITALHHCLHLGATHDAEQLVSLIDILDAWRTPEEKKSAYFSAIQIAGSLNRFKVTKYLSDFIYALPINERLSLPLSQNTWLPFLHGLSWKNLLEAQLASAESDTGTNYILARHGLQNHKLAFEAKALSIEADQRHIAFKLGQLQAKYDLLTYSLDCKFNFVLESDQLYYTLNAKDCPICYGQSLFPPHREDFDNDFLAESSDNDFDESQFSETESVVALTASNRSAHITCFNTHDSHNTTLSNEVPDASTLSVDTDSDNDSQSYQCRTLQSNNKMPNSLTVSDDTDSDKTCSSDTSEADSTNTQIQVAQYLRLKYGYANVSDQTLTAVSKELCRKYNIVHSPQCAGDCLTCSMTDKKLNQAILVTIPCTKHHALHFDCFLEWFSVNSKCPKCEEDIQSA